ncbi:MAG: amino acid aminotransferase [Bacteroidetes bacterium]|nr:amino acid aminotransferase [Bacteroidota bacterium]
MTQVPLAYIDGSFLPAADAALSVDDLGLQRGYGIFDFLRVEGRVPLFLEDHLQRFSHSAYLMHMPVPVSPDALTTIIHQIIDSASLPVSGIRFLLTGGSSSDGYTLNTPRLLILRQPLAAPPEQLPTLGLHLCSYEYRRQLSSVKTTDYLMSIWLQPWLKEKGGDDILYHVGGQLRECPRANIFFVTAQGILVTPEDGMLAGITRKHVLEVAAQQDIPVEIRDVTLAELATVQEAFITSSTKRLLPVCRIDGKPFHTPGPVTKMLWDAFLVQEQAYLQVHAR